MGAMFAGINIAAIMFITVSTRVAIVVVATAVALAVTAAAVVAVVVRAAVLTCFNRCQVEMMLTLQIGVAFGGRHATISIMIQ